LTSDRQIEKLREQTNRWTYRGEPTRKAWRLQLLEARLSVTRRTAGGLLLYYLRSVRGHALPPAITLDPGVCPSVLSADILAFKLRLVGVAACGYGRISVNADLYIVGHRRSAYTAYRSIEMAVAWGRSVDT
jgi:hypothetical protein